MVDDDVVLKAQGGDKDAIERVLKSSTGILWNVVKKFHAPGMEAADFYSEATIAVLGAIKSFNVEKSKWTTWVSNCVFSHLCTFAKVHTIRRRTSIMREALSLDAMEEGFDDPEDPNALAAFEEITSDADVKEIVRAANLTPYQRKVLSAKIDFPEATMAELAEMLGLRPKQFDNALTLTRMKMRETGKDGVRPKRKRSASKPTEGDCGEITREKRSQYWVPLDVAEKIVTYRKEGMSIHGIGKRLTAEGVPPPRGKGWHHGAILRSLVRLGYEE